MSAASAPVGGSYVPTENPFMPVALRCSLAVILCASALAADEVKWQDWSDEAFARARAEHRLVLLDLGAVWCHWCHVMDDTTYRDPAVTALLRDRYVAIRVDQDARPDLANRYEDYGWPATIIFAADGSELVKRRGYLKPEQMASILQAVVDDPTPGPSVEAEPARSFAATATALSDEMRSRLLKEFSAAYDHEHGGWGIVHKYIDADTIEYAELRAAGGDREAEAMATETLTAALSLIDPVWGGACQYSAGGDWKEPHYEKIVPVQADFIRTYARAWQRRHEQRWLDAAQAVHRYLREFLMAPDGGFFTSQDADLVPGEHSADYYALENAARRARGIPRVDRHRYARDTGLAIAALAELHAATGDRAALDEALAAARWVIADRALDGGGFRHDERDSAGPYLADTLAMGRAFLALYAVTADRDWLRRAEDARGFIDARFRDEVGYRTAAGPAPRPERDENVALARWAAQLARCTGIAADRAAAEHAFRWLSEPGIAAQRPTAGTLLADEELWRDPATSDGSVGVAERLRRLRVTAPAGKDSH